MKTDNNTQQLPAEVHQKIHADTNMLYDQLDSAAREVDSYDFGLPQSDRQTEPIRNLLTEYATKLHQVEQEKEFYKTKLINEKEFFEDGYKDLQARHTAASALLEKVITRQGRAVNITDPELYNEIKQFLDGKTA